MFIVQSNVNEDVSLAIEVVKKAASDIQTPISQLRTEISQRSMKYAHRDPYYIVNQKIVSSCIGN